MSHIVKIIRLAKPYHKWIILLSILVLIGAIVTLVQTVLIKFVIDQIQLQLTSGNGNFNIALVIFAVMFLLNMIATVLDTISMRLGDYTTGRIGKYLTETFYEKIFTLPQKYFDSELSGKILNQLSRGIVSLQDFLGAMANFIFPALIQTVFSLALLAYYNWIIALLAFIIFPMYVVVSYFSTKKWGEYQVKRNKIEDVTRGRIGEVIVNMKLVKGFNMQREEYLFVSQANTKSLTIYDKQSVSYHVLNFIRNFGLEIALMVIGGIAIYQTFYGLITFGTFVLIIQLLNQLRRPLFAMSFILERIKRAESGSKEFLEILDLPSVEKFSTDSRHVEIFSASKKILNQDPKGSLFGIQDDNKAHVKDDNVTLEFKKVSFEYEQKGETVLKDVSFSLKQGEITALVGESGAGKTTITNLILKFYDPSTGEILLNNTSYKKLTHENVRGNIALVFQDSELFSTTIGGNVSYGTKDATDSEIINALKKAHAWEFVKKYKKTLDEEIGERGVKLSGGQKQRIQIARAILHNAPILILDEATSSLDAKSEKLVQDALEILMKDKLVIVIAHRFSTIQNADKVMVIEKGTIVDSGKSEELAGREGIYRELLRYQVEGNKKLLAKYELS